MALCTAAGLAGEFEPMILAPEGPALAEARATGFEAIPFAGAWQFSQALRGVLARSKRVAFLATGVMHSGVCLAWNQIYRRPMAHLHLVHGGAAEKLSYGRKRKLNGYPVDFVAVSSYVRDRLIANGVEARQIHVIENFLPRDRAASGPRRKPFAGEAVEKLIVISRLDPEKRVDLLLDALERAPDPRRFEVRIFGGGWDAEKLKARAERSNLRVRFEGFQPGVAAALAESDLLVHLCPVEPFGLAIIEAMAGSVPVLAPNSGGAGSLVEDEVSGFHFHADDSGKLLERLSDVAALSADRLNAIAGSARGLLDGRFSEAARIGDYRRLIMEKLK
jgi:glycosyltransferase involved in cell wall biosynthesis